MVSGFSKVFLILCFLSYKGLAQESRIQPKRLGETGFEDSLFSLGVTHSRLTNRTQEKFSAQNPGVTLAWRQYIWGCWFGGLRLHTTEWAAIELKPSSAPESTQDVTFFQLESEVRCTPRWPKMSEQVWLQNLQRKFLSPYFGFGLGALIFLKNRGFPIERSKIEKTQPSMSILVGNKFVLNNYLALGISWENFRGVKTFDYTGNRWMGEILIGDVTLPKSF
jgi:hypothetical protein